jgi:hypothetical protein
MERAVALLKSTDRRLKRAERQFARVKVLSPRTVLKDCQSILERIRKLRGLMRSEKVEILRSLVETIKVMCITLDRNITLTVGEEKYEISRWGGDTIRRIARDGASDVRGVHAELDEKPEFWELLHKCVELIEEHFSSSPELKACARDLKPLTAIAERIARLAAPLAEAPAPDS